jgi:biopolymer transport protein TolQ
MLQSEPVSVDLSTMDLLALAGTETLVVLSITLLLSLGSWFIIGLKWWQLRRLSTQSRQFFAEMDRHPGLREAYRVAMQLPPSPYSQLFREAIHFYTQLHPAALGEGPRGNYSLSDAQLEALKMVLAKEISTDRDAAAQYVPWLATIGAVSPLLGLLGTVLGVMNAFLGIATRGSGNIGAVAPGVAEALLTTVAGLAVAIPAVMAYNYFAGRVSRLEGELEGLGNRIVGWMAREGLL